MLSNADRSGIRQALLESYKHKHVEGTKCVLCGRAGAAVALHVLEFYHPDGVATPASFVPMSRSRGTTRGSVPVCIRCGPRCQKCSLPIATRWTGKMATALDERYHDVRIVPGNGVCRHTHVLLDVQSLFRAVRLAEGAPRSTNAVELAFTAFRDIEARGDVPGFEFVKDEVLARLQHRDRTTISIVDNRVEPRGLVYLLITNVAYEELCSGECHTYRGVLSYKGEQLRAAFTVASERMIESGLHDRGAYEADVARLEKEISQIG